LKHSNGKHLYIGIWQHFKYFLQHLSPVRSRGLGLGFQCEVSSLGVEVLARSRGLGIGFQVLVSAFMAKSPSRSWGFSQVSVSEVTVSTTSLAFI